MTRSKDTYLQARYKRLAAHRGPLKALVAIEHSIITAIWHMLTDYRPYNELGGSYFTQRDPERATRQAINRLNQLGYTVTLNPIEGAARPPPAKCPTATTTAGYTTLPSPTLTWTYLRVRYR
ncbi:hypothetical protein AB0N07_38560 [Streptomyces sp. NPDC051172]|uniref:hypothetical protein n=1 Tax=Streptomyces sp. NPDC051172 TaxID=3155796 RepID=UPI003445E109